MATTPYLIALDTEQRLTLEALSHKASAPYRVVLRARIALAADDGLTNVAIADELVCMETRCVNGGDGSASAARRG